MIKVLELACGNGRQSRILKEKYPNTDITAIDLSDEMINICRQQTPETMNIKYIQGNAQDITYIEEFDLIFASYMINYLNTTEEIPKFCSSIYKSLKKDCCFITYHPEMVLKWSSGVNNDCEKYGHRTIYDSKRDPMSKNGDKILVELWNPENEESTKTTFYCSYNSQHMLETCFKETGFDIIWKDAELDPLESKRDPDYWYELVNSKSPGYINVW